MTARRTTPSARKRATLARSPSRRSARRTGRSAAQTVDEYLAATPKPARAALEKLRATIRRAAPDATEGISYRVPTFKHRGPLVGFAAFEDHCSFFLMSTTVVRTHARLLEGYELGKGTIRFTPEKPLPTTLVTTLVKARIAENESAKSR
jgi:uncharacterized protein YdhG (YjbR/CyaY superfamily)